MATPTGRQCMTIADGNAYVLTRNGIIAAYTAIIFGIEPAYSEITGKWLTNGNYAVIHRVAVASAMKGKGMATILFKLAENLAAEHNVFSIKVDTNFDNIAMLKILAKLGYSYCGEIFFSGASRRAYEKVLNKQEK